MKNKLEELRRELGIPHDDDSDDEHLGLTTIRPSSPCSTVFSNADRLEEDFDRNISVTDRTDRAHRSKKKKMGLPTLKQNKNGRPPLPKGSTRFCHDEGNLDSDRLDNYGSTTTTSKQEVFITDDSTDFKKGDKPCEYLDVVEELDTPKASSRYSSDITVTPRGETSESGGGGRITPINESEDDSVLDKPESVGKVFKQHAADDITYDISDNIAENKAKDIAENITYDIADNIANEQEKVIDDDDADSYEHSDDGVIYNEPEGLDTLELYKHSLQMQESSDDGESVTLTTPTPAKRSVKNSMTESTLSLELTDNESSLSLTKPTPRKRTSITPRRETTDSESIVISELDDTNAVF